MNNLKKIELINLLEKNIKKSNGNKLNRIIRQPLFLPLSKLIEITLRIIDKEKKVRARLFWGKNMTVVIPEIVSCYLYRYGYFEKDLTKIIINNLNEGDTFLDIGAHFGYYSLLASELLGLTGSVHSFEPTFGTFNIAQKNLSQKNIKLNNLAVWSKRDKLKIKVYKTQFSAFNTIFSPKLDADTVKSLKFVENYIDTITIDDYVQELKIIPSFIKIDAENSEIEILKGMSNILNSAKPIISIEMGDVDLKDSSSSRACVEFLISKNYSPFEIHDGELKEHKIKNRYGHMNLIFKPN